MVSRGWVLTIGVLFHLIYLRSIFDIYFKSPVVSVEEQHGSSLDDPAILHEEGASPADRLFLIVGDGLRADKLFENPQLAPFLHDKAINSGRWGISHTRVPTESRPGHVALIAGLYEDVSAVTTGWKLNPINFDSVFNQSRKTWAWGSPDILPMFREGATIKENVICEMYDSEEEDFTEDSDKLDTWVFEHVDALFAKAKDDEALARDLRAPKSVFFLHLLGLDTAGHAHRPYSKEYLNNIAVVDNGIAQLMKTLEGSWSQQEMERTTFLFTADHGMSDWGSHGDGHPDNTRTPYIAWGSGVRKPSPYDPLVVSASLKTHHTAHERLNWSVEQNSRVDVAQADLAAFMSYSVNIPFPKNNVGLVPTELLTADEQSKAVAIFQNARQIHAQYSSKAELKARMLHYSNMIHYTFDKDYYTTGMTHIRNRDWPELSAMSQDWIHESLKGMRYLQKYDWLFLRTIISLGYLGWMLFALIFVIKSYVIPYTGHYQALAKEKQIELLMGQKIVPGSATRNANGHPTYLPPAVDPNVTSSSTIVDASFGALAVGVLAYLLEKSSPLSYYAYAAFPVYFWYKIIQEIPAITSSLRTVTTTSKRAWPAALGLALLGVVIIQGVVNAYAHRQIISIMWPLASVTPFLYPGASSSVQKTAWVMLCTAMSTFTSLPTVQTEDIRFVVLGGALMALIGLAYILLRGGSFTLGAQVGLVALTTMVTKESSQSLADKQGLPLGCQVLGWTCLVSSLLLPLCHRLERKPGETINYQQRLIILFLTFAPTFVILSVSYEGLFYLVFWALLVTWMHLESGIADSLAHDSKVVHTTYPSSESGHRGLQFSDARVALYFFFLIQAAFFGTGNIASVSSFSLDSVYRLIPIFSPFAMGLLLLFKLLVPFAVISATLGLLNRKLKVAPSAIFMTVLTFCDILTLNFFWMVRDEGSWLEIGSSISAFVIGGLLILFVICLEKVSEWMVGDVVM
ncbi:putative GPI-anchor biosynthetic protein [Taphrina deformans PYCC 5710]|uniref:GPI ethanolamine phosphate transferase 1 n=1 Tax=Taphrina deformans (strain PYCC 5710 / ATCC 11124 / CBS 356.35 / IMI 108563 / JCM 9778 / NBRC 8474) TaxID=1097556 RepID=R4XCD8_TAPDE|nr:putative GPI-anchor biosynthetic protein [Taphrina deformans PYCC 5710]|eukprot:CCG83486.1 putative GPI-anchor biosynthetic protein [Taphrina deformans PYCC 5710]